MPFCKRQESWDSEKVRGRRGREWGVSRRAQGCWGLEAALGDAIVVDSCHVLSTCPSSQQGTTE